MQIKQIMNRTKSIQIVVGISLALLVILAGTYIFLTIKNKAENKVSNNNTTNTNLEAKNKFPIPNDANTVSVLATEDDTNDINKDNTISSDLVNLQTNEDSNPIQ